MRKFGILMLLVSAFGFMAMTISTDGTGYGIGDQAEDFELKNVDGEMVSLADFEDAKGYIVIFTCNACPYAKLYEDRIIAINEKYAEKGFPVIAINPNDPGISPGDSYAKMQEKAKEKEYQFPYVFDEKQEVFPRFGATRTPHVFLLDSERVVRYIGAIDDSPRNAEKVEEAYLDAAVQSIMEGSDPEPATTKAVGCTIKVEKS